MDASDDDLIRRYRDGDARAFDVLFDRHHAAVYHFAATMLGEGPAAEDVLQESFLAVARAAREYEPRGRMRAWLMRIVRNRCLNRIEQDRRRREVTGQVDAADAVAGDPAPDAGLAADEAAAIVRSAIDELPERQREAITLYAFERMTYREIASVLEMPINTVKTLIHRARASLAAALGPGQRESQREL